MNAAPHLVVAVASHGWGHLSQTVPMVAALARRIPGLRVTVRTGLDPALVRARFEAQGLPAPPVSADDTEFGFAMHDALNIDDDASLARYRMLFAERGRRLERERDALRALRADAVLANVGWLPPAAAASLGLPAFVASSLNWADLLGMRHPDRPDVAPIVEWMRDGYARADAVFALAPGMPFDGFPNRVPVAPIARRGRARPAELRAALGVPADLRLAVAAFGGMPMRLDTRRWRLPDGWFAIAMTDDAVDGPSVRAGDSLGWSFIDLMASVDLLIAKPGYGTFAEAGFAGRDTLWVPRDDWPESPYLVEWLGRHARAARIPTEALRAGEFAAPIAEVMALPRRPAAEGDGAAAIAAAVALRLGVPDPVSPTGTGARTGG